MDVFWAEGQHFNYLMSLFAQMSANKDEKKQLSNAELLSVMTD